MLLEDGSTRYSHLGIMALLNGRAYANRDQEEGLPPNPPDQPHPYEERGCSLTISAEKRDIIAKIMRVPPEELEYSRVFRIIAGAGVGKSVLITELARLAADRSILFLSSSRNIADRARLSLPKSVRVQTLYSQALSFVEHRYKSKMKRQAGRMWSRIPIRAIMQSGYVETTREAAAARAAVEQWIYSTRSTPDEGDIPAELKSELSKDSLARVVKGARSIATSQGNPDTDTIPLTYDFIIREWASARGVVRLYGQDGAEGKELDPLSGAGLIVLEEAQDCPPIVYSFLKRQRIALLMLGDRFQTLRPINVRDEEQHPFLSHDGGRENAETMTLDASYRFGQPIASLLNALTHYAAGDAERDRLRGLGKSSVFTPDRRGHMEKMGFHYAFIARSLSTVLREAVRLASQGAYIAWVDGISSYNIQAFRDLMAIGMREVGIDREATPTYLRHLRQFESLQDAHQHFTSQRDNHHLGLVELCMELQAHRANYLTVIDRMIHHDQRRQEALQRNWQNAPTRHVTMMTTTRAKGSEFDRVVVSDDLAPPGLLRSGPMSPQRQASLHHLYTAISRAKYEVVLPIGLVDWISGMGFGKNRPALAMNQLSPEDPVKTPLWHSEFGPSPQILLEMVPENRLRRAGTVPTLYKPRFNGDPAGSVKRAFEEELKRQKGESAKGPEALKVALRDARGK